MTDNVLPLPTRIERLVKLIQNDLQRRVSGDREWIEGSYDLCLHLVELREQFVSNAAFGQACEAHGFGKDTLNEDTRAAAINMGREPEALRKCLEATTRRSLEMIYRREFDQFRSAPKPATRLRSTPKTPPAKKEEHAAAVYDQLTAEGRTLTRQELADEAGVSVGTAARVFFKREAQPAVPPLDPATVAPSVRERMEAWQRAERKRLRLVIEAELRPQYAHQEEAWFKHIWERVQWAERFLETRNGIMSRGEYQVILKCLHPDTRPDDALKGEAFRLFTRHKDVLLKPEPKPLDPRTPPLPETAAEFERLREKVKAERAAKRAASQAARASA